MRDHQDLEFEAFPILVPEDDPHDPVVQVKLSTLRRGRGALGNAARPGFPWHELCLALSTLAIGVTWGRLGAGTADLPANSRGYVLYYSILPSLFMGFLLAYIFLRNATHRDPFNAATEALRILPDPDKTN